MPAMPVGALDRGLRFTNGRTSMSCVASSAYRSPSSSKTRNSMCVQSGYKLEARYAAAKTARHLSQVRDRAARLCLGFHRLARRVAQLRQRIADLLGAGRL